MSRDEGFAVMDVSTSMLGDTKIKRLLRHCPDHYTVAVVAYFSTMAESWKAGRRLSVEDCWPVGVPVDPLAIEALVHVGLLDGSGFIVVKTWRSWFGKAKSRRSKSRADWRKWQQEHRKRQGGVSPDSGPDKPIPSVPTVRPSDPSVPSKDPQGGTSLDGGPRLIGLADPSRKTA